MWIIERRDGTHQYLASEPDPIRDGPIVRQAHADRQPSADGTEDWDFDRGMYVTNVQRAEAWIDRQNGAEAIAIAHAVKVLEARQYLMGQDVNGLLALEAAETGQDLGELVGKVLENADDWHRAEVRRIAMKRAVRAENSQTDN